MSFDYKRTLLTTFNQLINYIVSSYLTRLIYVQKCKIQNYQKNCNIKLIFNYIINISILYICIHY